MIISNVIQKIADEITDLTYTIWPIKIIEKFNNDDIIRLEYANNFIIWINKYNLDNEYYAAVPEGDIVIYYNGKPKVFSFTDNYKNIIMDIVKLRL